MEIDNNTQPRMRNSPPMGVTAPKKVILEMLRVYNEPEKITIPKSIEIAEVLSALDSYLRKR